MKKTLVLVMSLIMIISLFAGYGHAEDSVYPLAGNRKITYGCSIIGNQTAAGYENAGETVFAKTAMEATGIEVEYVQGSGGNWFSLMIAEGNYPDILEAWWNSAYPGGLKGAADDGVIIPLNDVIDQYMPNLKALLEAYPEDAENLYYADGNIYGIPYIAKYRPEGDYSSVNTTGLMIRKGILDELGLDIPVTIDDWHTVLSTIHEKTDLIPFTTTMSYVISAVSGGPFAPSFVPPTNTFAIDYRTNQVVFNAITDDYKALLTVMNQWYEEGLLDPDLTALDNATAAKKFQNGEAAAYWGWSSTLDGTMDDAIPVPNALRDENAEICHLWHTAEWANDMTCDYYSAISNRCQDVEAVARYLDYFFSPEGIMLCNFGIEGLTYVMEDGKPVYTDEILNNPDGLTNKAAQGKYLRAYSGFPGVRTLDFTLASLKREEAKQCFSVWGSVGETKFSLPLSFRLSEEGKAFSADLLTELKPYVEEMCMKFVLGTADIETEWDSYVNTVKNNFDLAQALEYYQEAYDAYLARK